MRKIPLHVKYKLYYKWKNKIGDLLCYLGWHDETDRMDYKCRNCFKYKEKGKWVE